nr:helix-turn-helix domain-containing protein [Halomonas salinarum]
MGYRQLPQTQRYQIYARHDLGMSRRQIARELGIHNSTVSRELRRNAADSGYDPEQDCGKGKQRAVIAVSDDSFNDLGIKV